MLGAPRQWDCPFIRAGSEHCVASGPTPINMLDRPVSSGLEAHRHGPDTTKPSRKHTNFQIESSMMLSRQSTQLGLQAGKALGPGPARCGTAGPSSNRAKLLVAPMRTRTVQAVDYRGLVAAAGFAPVPRDVQRLGDPQLLGASPAPRGPPQHLLPRMNVVAHANPLPQEPAGGWPVGVKVCAPMKEGSKILGECIPLRTGSTACWDHGSCLAHEMHPLPCSHAMILLHAVSVLAGSQHRKQPQESILTPSAGNLDVSKFAKALAGGEGKRKNQQCVSNVVKVNSAGQVVEVSASNLCIAPLPCICN